MFPVSPAESQGDYIVAAAAGACFINYSSVMRRGLHAVPAFLGVKYALAIHLCTNSEARTTVKHRLPSMLSSLLRRIEGVRYMLFF